MIFRPEHAEDVSVIKSSFWVCFWLICERNIRKDMNPTYNCLCVYLPVLLIKRLRILTTKFEHSFFFFNDLCIHKPLNCIKTCYKMIFRPEHAEDISVVKSSFWVCFWLICERNIKRDMNPTYNCLCVYLPVLLITRLHILTTKFEHSFF